MQIPKAEGKDEILPPTIQKIIKGYNKYLRPFFDSKYKSYFNDIEQ